jgi:carbamoyltransferase
MNIIGIHGDFFNEKGEVNESSVSIVSNGKLVACVAEERLTRIKVDGSFPVNAITDALKIAGLSINEIDKVAITSLHPTETNKKYLKSAISTYRDTGVVLRDKIKNFAWNYIYNRFKSVKEHKRNILGKEFSLIYTDHHLAHAAGAYYCAPFNEALVITLDGGGDGLDGIAAIGKGNKLNVLFEIPHFQSPGTMYSAITNDLGFKRHKHEGKITGLAAFGNNDIKRLGLESLLKYDEKKHRFISKDIANHHKSLLEKSAYFYPLLSQFSREDIAAACQRIFEEEVLRFIADAHNEATRKGVNLNKICLAGGCFANVKLNQRILEMGLFDNLFVFPAMGDDGLSAGAALLAYYSLNPSQKKDASVITDTYMGGAFSNDEIEEALKSFGLEYERKSNIEKEIAGLLANKKVVARYNGRMEYGPRALGNRSVIGAPFDKSINDWLNKKFNRTEFMPFAPSILEEYAAEYLEGYSEKHIAADFMTVTYDIKKGMADKIPAVVHIDNTARPQIVRKSTNQSYHSIIEEFYKLTGVPVVLNTSFNMHEEPIVYTPNDAVRAFLDAQLDYLAIGNYLVKYKSNIHSGN